MVNVKLWTELFTFESFWSNIDIHHNLKKIEYERKISKEKNYATDSKAKASPLFFICRRVQCEFQTVWLQYI